MGSGSLGEILQFAEFSGDAFSPAATVVTDASNSATRSFSLTTLADGRVVLAYCRSTSDVLVGFFDGAGWSAFTPVPGIDALGNQPVAVAAGVRGNSVLEMATIGSDQRIRYTRLTDEANWVWTPATEVDPTGPGGLAAVSIAVGR
jgi:hypothetical protein